MAGDLQKHKNYNFFFINFVFLLDVLLYFEYFLLQMLHLLLKNKANKNGLEMKDYLTIPKVAKICSVDRSTMHRWVTSGKINAYSTPGGHKRIQIKDLKKFLKDNQMPIALDDFEKGSKRILIVDDDAVIQKFLKKLLTRPLMEIEAVSDGFAAGIKLVTFKPNLVLLDLSMPNIDGFEVCRNIKENPLTKHIKVLIFTGHEIEENKKKALSLGADGFLTKSCSKEKIIDVVEEMLKRQV